MTEHEENWSYRGWLLVPRMTQNDEVIRVRTLDDRTSIDHDFISVDQACDAIDDIIDRGTV